MPITVDWGDFEETILVWKIEGNWTLEDYLVSRDQGTALAEQRAPVIVDVIADMRRSALMPHNIVAVIRDALEVARFAEGIITVITPTNYWTQLVHSMQKTYFRTVKFPIVFVRDVDAAYELVETVQAQRRASQNIG